MQQLVDATRSALSAEDPAARSAPQRNMASEGLRLLGQYEPELVKAYPMALLEIFAEGPSTVGSRGPATDTAMDFGELSLMDDSEVQAQVELARAQQTVLHATDAVLTDLNTLVSSAQGLRSVQPERNPLRPENYIRALQRVVGGTGVPAEVRQLWMQHMRDILGRSLVEEYRKTAAILREHGVQPVGYGVLGGGGVAFGGSAWGSPGGYADYGPSGNGPMGDYGSTGHGRGPAWTAEAGHGAMAPEAEEALLTVGVLRQMLAAGDPFDPGARGGEMVQGAAAPAAAGRAATAEEAIEDLAQLERLVGRLAGSVVDAGTAGPVAGAALAAAAGGLPAEPGQVPAGWLGPGVSPVVYAAMPADTALHAPEVAVEVVARMVQNISQDPRLLRPVQKAVQALEPALRQLVRRDGRFFTDAMHPARRILDELTQRSLAFESETAPGFSRFMRLFNEAVDYLVASRIRDAGPFETVFKALQAAWDMQEKKARADQELQRRALLYAEQREVLAEKIASDIRQRADLDNVPVDIVEFAAGPWADVIALAQVLQEPGAQVEDPGGYRALVPVLLWSAQPALTRREPDRLNDAIPGLLAKLRKGLKTINHPAMQTSALLQRLVGLHQEAFDKSVSRVAAAAGAAGGSAPPPGGAPAGGALPDPFGTTSTPVPLEPQEPAGPDPFADCVVGSWVELLTNGRVVTTQLTWASPQGTLFLFTAADASTQSMTRRMRDKLAAQGLIRLVPAPAAVVPAGSSPGPRKPGTR